MAGPVTASPVEPLDPTSPVVSLLTSAVRVDDPLGAWTRTGISYRPRLCLPPDDPYWWGCVSEDGDLPPALDPPWTKTAPEKPDLRIFRPIDAWTGDRCGPAEAARSRANAESDLDRFLSRLVEDELWTGARADLAGYENDRLNDATDLVDGGAPLSPIEAFAELEQALADGESGLGMIHAQPRVVTRWLSENVVFPEATGTRLRSRLGTIVVPGAGYDGSGPGLAAGDEGASYAYATSLVRVYLGAVNTYESRNIETNDVGSIAERPFIAEWSGCTKTGALVDLTNAAAS